MIRHRMWSILIPVIAGCLVGGVRLAVADVPLTLRIAGRHDVVIEDRGEAGWSIRTTGTDPYAFLETAGSPFDLANTPVLTFDIDANRPMGEALVFVGPDLVIPHMLLAPDQPGKGTISIDLTETLEPVSQPIRSVRMRFGTQPGLEAMIRNIRVRPCNADELAIAAHRVATLQDDRLHEQRLREYLATTFPHRIDAITVSPQMLMIQGTIDRTKDSSELWLAATPLWGDVTSLKDIETLRSVEISGANAFSLEIPRFDTQGRNRLLDGFVIVKQSDHGKAHAVSSLHYVTEQKPRADLPPANPRSKKGLGGCPFDHPDMAALGIASVTLNIVLDDLFYTEPASGRSPFTSQGKTWYVNDRVLAEYDRVLTIAVKKEWLVSAIILIRTPRHASPTSWHALVAHPDASPTSLYALPNFTTCDGTLAYTAALDFLAERYNRIGSPCGRVHDWIMHNEINSGFYWASAGNKTPLTYMDLYQKSMRLMQTLARQYDPHAKALVSLDHGWGQPTDPRCHAGKTMLEDLGAFSRKEGDFDWGIAFHPYAQDLNNPRTWEDPEATTRPDTPFITFRNIEVLDAWVRQPDVRFPGTEFREIQLTEQGLNSPDYSEQALAEQAAGVAYAWEKIAPLSSVTAFQYHLWADAREEYGLRLGLRKFADEPSDPLGKKPAWTVYEAIGTPHWDEATRFTLPIIGIKSWDELRSMPVKQ